MRRLAFLAGALFLLASALQLKAEVFESTYKATPCNDYELISELLIGPGVSRRPRGALIPQTDPLQVGVYSNLVAKEARVVPFTNGGIISTGTISFGSSLVNTEAGKDHDDESRPYIGQDSDLDNYFGTFLDNPAGIILYVQPKNNFS